MVINYDIQKINRMLKDFYNATGISMDLLKADFSFLGNKSFWENKKYCKAIQSTESGRRACLHSDSCLLKKSRESKQVEMHVCHSGLVDVSVPVLYHDTIIGYLIFGQFRIDTDFSAAEEYLQKLGLDKVEMREYYSEIEVWSTEQITSISNIAQMLVKHILLEKMLKPDLDESLEKVVAYINENLERRISVQSLSKHTNISKSALYLMFHNHFHCTVGQYINQKRIERSLELLAENSLSIEEIATRTGFSDGSHFSKTFKKEKSISPLKYKKEFL
ncbi:MAG: PocR ligand-binding domain-containing protein [Clostridia bacterium]|nr:PocR ligand-binding domain-containing protein [Clostridia bacterium]